MLNEDRWNPSFERACLFCLCVFSARTCPMSPPHTVWCAMAPVPSGDWRSEMEAAAGGALWLQSEQLLPVTSLSVLAGFLLVSVLLLLCASCKGWAPAHTRCDLFQSTGFHGNFITTWSCLFRQKKGSFKYFYKKCLHLEMHQKHKIVCRFQLQIIKMS